MRYAGCLGAGMDLRYRVHDCRLALPNEANGITCADPGLNARTRIIIESSTRKRQVHRVHQLGHIRTPAALGYANKGAISGVGHKKLVSVKGVGNYLGHIGYQAIEFKRTHPCAVSYTHLRAHETDSYLVCRL